MDTGQFTPVNTCKFGTFDLKNDKEPFSPLYYTEMINLSTLGAEYYIRSLF